MATFRFDLNQEYSERLEADAAAKRMNIQEYIRYKLFGEVTIFSVDEVVNRIQSGDFKNKEFTVPDVYTDEEWSQIDRGNAGVLGGVTKSLRNKGVAPLTTTDGPSGIRIKACCSLLPIGASLSAMWNPDLAYEMYKKVGGEMKAKGSDILLAPGMNIHRSPLCGRNFEYFSEDPFVTGKTATAVVKGVQSEGVSACP